MDEMLHFEINIGFSRKAESGFGRPKKPTFKSSYGFTLIELLVAAATMGLLVALLGSVMSSGTTLLNSSKNALNANAQMRFVLDRIQSDFRHAVWREDTDPYFLPSACFSTVSGNDSIVFPANVRGYAGDRPLSAIGYRISGPAVVNGKPSASLQRGVTGSFWEASAGAQVKFGYEASTTLDRSPLVVAPADYEDLGDLIFRMEISFVEKSTGHIRSAPPALKDLQGVIVTLAALDRAAVQRLSSTAELAALVALFSDTDEAATAPPLAQWQKTLESPGSFSKNTASLLSHVKLLSRQFYVRP